MELVVGRIGRSHGIHGEVSVEVHTDDVEHRFAAGSVLDTDPPERGPLTVLTARPHRGRLLVRFDGVPDRTAADTLRGVLLVADSATSTPSDDPDEYWDHQLIGLAVATVDGVDLGTVQDVLHPPGTALLAVRTPQDVEVLIPFVAAIVPTVDLAAGRVVVDPPDGLLDP